jgi:allophanate hydrolase subunit 2
VRAGAELVVESEPLRVAYLAIQGGVDAPLVFGSRATQLSAGIGARLRANDRIATHDRISDARTHGGIPDTARRSPTAARATRDRISDSRPIRVIAGPDFEAFAPDVHAVLVNQTYKVLPSSDRVGTRLVAIDVGARPLPRVANFREASRPMALGAIEVPADGQPIVLGPEHPTTGGYPIVGVVAYDDLDRLFSIRLGDTVRFEVGHVGT